MARDVVVGVGNGPLGKALTDRLRKAFPGLAVRQGVMASARPGDVVIATSAEMSPLECAEAIGRHISVVVLSALGRWAERREYERAGAAAYVVMAVDDGAAVIAGVDRALAGQPGEGPKSAAPAISHLPSPLSSAS